MKVKIFLVSLFLWFVFPSSVFASAEFETHYTVTMEADKNGLMRVVQNISLTNRLSNVYATAYTLAIEKNRISNISAFDSKGLVSVETIDEDNQTKINLSFNDQVVGIGKTLNFTLKYTSNDMFTHSGQIWELMIPRLGSAEQIDNYDLTLRIPLSFGKPAYFSPNYLSSDSEGELQIFRFGKNQLLNTGVTAAFGEFQIYNFDLSYHLVNKENNKVKQQIALPPDTNYQKVKYFAIEPAPLEMNLDEDGNWLGTYILEGKQNLDIAVNGQVKIFATPVYSFSRSGADLANLMTEKDFWPVNDPQIQSLSRKLKTPKEIFDFVTEKLTYDYSRARIGAKRLGALEILNNPDRAICMEFTDLFVTLARAAGIPARELNGFAYTDNPRLRPLSFAQDVLHAWPEYWDKDRKIWIQVDPTWQNTSGGVDYFTKLDQSHFVFAIHGLDSRYPLPAGAYKSSKDESKSVQVAFGKPVEDKIYLPQIAFQFPQQIFSEIPTKGVIVIENVSSEAFYDLNYRLESENLQFLPESLPKLDILLPFAKKEIKYALKPKKTFFQGEEKVTIVLNGVSKEYNVNVKSLVLGYLLPFIGGLIGTITLAVIALKARSLYLQKRAKQTDLYR